MTDDPLATIIVAPRERWSAIERCLATIDANTAPPYRLVCVFGGAPAHVVSVVEQICAERGYELIMRSEALSPNAARNLALSRTSTKYVAFIDNDVIVGPGWLDTLVACAEETGGAVVSPLVLTGEPANGVVHFLGGTLEFVGDDGLSDVVERHLLDHVYLNAQSIPLERQRCDFAEFHGMLVRRAVLDEIGPLDEDVRSADHVDFALRVRALGGTTWSEPDALIAYLPGGYEVGDLEYYAVRWSDDWHERSLARLSERWSIVRHGRFFTDLTLWQRRHQARCTSPRQIRPGRTVDPAHHAFAQTIVQLFNQMQAAGYPPEDLAAARAAYDAAASLVAAHFRPSGKPFLAHLVGTASILADHGAHAALIAAGIAHATYTFGDLPRSAGADFSSRQRWLRRRVGSLAEAIVDEYVHLDRTSLEAFLERDGLEHLPVNVANAVLLRIANQVEERLDDAPGYYSTSETADRAAQDLREWEPVYRVITERLCTPDLLTLLLDLDAHAARARIPAEARFAWTTNFVIDPTTGTPHAVAPLPIVPRQLLRPRATREFVVPPRRPALGRHESNLDLRGLTPSEAGRVKRRRGAADISCDPRQWAYSALLALGGYTMDEPAVLRVTVRVEAGLLGVGVLAEGSLDEFVAPEMSQGPSSESVDLYFALPSLREAGTLVLRSWATDGTCTRARVAAVDLFLADAESLVSFAEAHALADR